MSSPLITAACDLKNKGKIKSPRGIKVLELRDYSLIIDNPLICPVVKPVPINYTRKEFQWYLNGHNDPKDDRITKHAKMWANFIQPDGTFASNYGQYMFRPNGGFKWIVDILTKDPDSRQAVIPFAYAGNIYKGNKDQICTLGLFFDISGGELNMTVIMRSNDVIGFGAPNDWVCFNWFFEMIAVELRVCKGEYRHFAHSFHAYEKDWYMMDKIIDSGVITIDYPKITDAKDLINQTFESDFGRWLTEEKL